MAFSESSSPMKKNKVSDPTTPQGKDVQTKSGKKKEITIRTNKAKEESHIKRRESLEQEKANYVPEWNSARRSSEKSKYAKNNTDLPLQMDLN